MPHRSLRPCTFPGCTLLTKTGRCEPHRQQTRRESEVRRDRTETYLYDSRWSRARRRFLREHPFCVECDRSGKVRLATEVDHIIPHKGDPVKFWRESNWQSLCHHCHSVKTASEEGGFGNPLKPHA